MGGRYEVGVRQTAEVAVPSVSGAAYRGAMAETFDPAKMISRFQERAEAVKKRNLPPVGGEERQMFIRQAEEDYMDFAMIGDAEATMEDGVLTLRVNLSGGS